MKAFFDTNVLIYAVTADPRKQQADRVLRAGGIVSVQVLNEFANVAHNKLRHDWNVIEFALSQFKLSFESSVHRSCDRAPYPRCGACRSRPRWQLRR